MFHELSHCINSCTSCLFHEQKVKDAAVVGPHDAVVVHAENEATSFFARYGFSDDVILNNRWRYAASTYKPCSYCLQSLMYICVSPKMNEGNDCKYLICEF